MARFDVRRLKTKGRVSLVVEIQSDYMRDLPTVLVAPMIKITQLKPYESINPVVKIGEEGFALRLEQMGGVSADNLGETIASVSHLEAEISVALNRLLFYV